jgi:transposase-like protein
LVTIHGIVLENTLPLAFMLLKNKQEKTYERAFFKVKNEILTDPEYIIVDFEKSLINALSSVFMMSRLSGCIFHFGQACWRKTAKLKIDFGV